VATDRDVVILDSANNEVARHNLTQNNLSEPSNDDELKAILRRAAGE
jgi:hypothetical protein